MARIVEAVTRYRRGGMSCCEAAEFLGMSERHSRRLRDRYEAEGAVGIVDKAAGPSVGAPRGGGRGGARYTTL